MFVVLKVKVLFVLFITTSAQNSDDQLIKDVFGSPPNNNITSKRKGLSLDELIDGLQSTTKRPNLPNVGGSTDSSGCKCVPYYLCKDNQIITDGEGLIDIRIEGKCGNYLEVCCYANDITTTPITTTRAPPTTTNHCGIRNPDGVGFRITGDSDGEAQFGEFPWMVAILNERILPGTSKTIMVYQCGGSLIHPSVVLTAAHCVSNQDKKYVVRAGEWDTQTKNEILPDQDREVQTIVVHPHYRSGTLFNDIALLFLNEPMKIDANVDVICLPPQDYLAESKECFASGWGKDTFGNEGKYQVILKKLQLPIVDRFQCLQHLRNTRLGRHFELHRSFICAGGEAGKDTCKGDGGSPLVCPIRGHPGRYHQSGIVAWGIGCGEDNTPGVYVDVAQFRNWIDEQMNNFRLDTSSYKF